MRGSCVQDILLRAHSKFRDQGNFIQISGLDVGGRRWFFAHPG
jgi:hypothetical protein